VGGGFVNSFYIDQHQFLDNHAKPDHVIASCIEDHDLLKRQCFLLFYFFQVILTSNNFECVVINQHGIRVKYYLQHLTPAAFVFVLPTSLISIDSALESKRPSTTDIIGPPIQRTLIPGCVMASLVIDNQGIKMVKLSWLDITYSETSFPWFQ